MIDFLFRPSDIYRHIVQPYQSLVLGELSPEGFLAGKSEKARQHVRLPSWASLQGWLSAGGVTDVFVEFLLDRADNEGWRENGFRLLGLIVSV